MAEESEAIYGRVKGLRTFETTFWSLFSYASFVQRKTSFWSTLIKMILQSLMGLLSAGICAFLK